MDVQYTLYIAARADKLLHDLRQLGKNNEENNILLFCCISKCKSSCCEGGHRARACNNNGTFNAAIVQVSS